MRKSVFGITILALAGLGGYAALAAERCGPSSCASSAQAKTGTSCATATGVASCEAPRGKITGHFDPVAASACRFACATKLKYDPRDVLAQPGAKLGKLAQCPVSGVVFVVDAHRPRVKYAGDEYVTCCDRCATKLRQSPRHYLKA